MIKSAIYMKVSKRIFIHSLKSAFFNIAGHCFSCMMYVCIIDVSTYVCISYLGTLWSSSWGTWNTVGAISTKKPFQSTSSRGSYGSHGAFLPHVSWLSRGTPPSIGPVNSIHSVSASCGEGQ